MAEAIPEFRSTADAAALDEIASMVQGPIERRWMWKGSRDGSGAFIMCHWADDGKPDGFNPSPEDALSAALVVFRTVRDKLSLRIVLQLNEMSGQWKLANVNVRPAAWGERDAAFYLESAKAQEASPVGRLLALTAAWQLSVVGSRATRQIQREIESSLAVATEPSKLRDTLRAERLPRDHEYLNLNVVPRAEYGLLPQVDFVVGDVSDPTALRSKALSLLRHIRAQAPRFAQDFEEVEFRGLQSAPGADRAAIGSKSLILSAREDALTPPTTAP